jgi:hypothetical protein
MVRALNHICNNVGTEQTLAKVVDTFRPELVYERYSPFAVAGAIVSQQHGIRHILEVNALLAEEGRLYRKQALQEASEFLERQALGRTAQVITVRRVSALKESRWYRTGSTRCFYSHPRIR